ncbi:MAG TPA: hypothetical protein VKV15_08205 [Bryobacteraceae bacterium]|nr:hypothetical protein [Bryobacteraceae bacterium]
MEKVTEADLWKDTVWGSREAFVKARIEEEGYSSEQAEEYANVWEKSLRRLKNSPPQQLELRST